MSGLCESDAVILGSGASLRRLTTEERSVINQHQCTLGMNKFLLFHDILHIVPKVAFLADSHFPAPKVARDTIREAIRLGHEVGIYFNSDYAKLFQYSYRPKQLLKRIRHHYLLTREHRFLSGFSLFYPKIFFFRSNPFANNRPLFWAESLEQELYFHRGSLTTALNLVDVIFKPKRIVLLGVDLNSPEMFFSGDRRLQKYDDQTYKKLEQSYGLHGTACPHPHASPIQVVLKEIAEMLQRKGVQLVSGNPDSLLCELGICEHITVS